MADSEMPPILNPNTPLAFMDPKSAYETSVSIYITVAALGLLVWDMLDNIGEEFRAVYKGRITMSMVAYFLSRVGSLGYILGSAIFTTAPTGNCEVFEKALTAWYPVALGFSGLLFFFRVAAIYNRNPFVVSSFFVLWLGFFACTLFIPIGVEGTSVGGTKYCQDAFVPNTAYAAIIAPLVHDTLVFIAISWKLVQNAHVEGGAEGLKVVMFGKYLPTFTKGLLLDGQRYYLVTLISSLVTVVMAFEESVPVPLRSMAAGPNIVLVNIMACRVYRRTKAGIFRQLDGSTLDKSRVLPVISIATNRVRTTDEPSYLVDIELANRKAPSPNDTSGSLSNSEYQRNNTLIEKSDFTRSFDADK